MPNLTITQEQFQSVLYDMINITLGHRTEGALDRLQGFSDQLAPLVTAYNQTISDAAAEEEMAEESAAALAVAAVRAEYEKEQAAGSAAAAQVAASAPAPAPSTPVPGVS